MCKTQSVLRALEGRRDWVGFEKVERGLIFILTEYNNRLNEATAFHLTTSAYAVPAQLQGPAFSLPPPSEM